MNRQEAAKKVLINKKVKLEFIPERYNKHYTKIDPNHIGKSVYDGCKVAWELPLSAKHNGYYPILSMDEQKAFEILLERPEGALSFYRFNKPENFWSSATARVDIDKDGTTFDLSDPIQNLKWRITKVQPIVSETWEDRLNDLDYKWGLKDVGYVERVNADYAKLKREAYIGINKLNIDQQINVLLALGLKTPKNVDEDWLLNKFEDIIDTKVSKPKNPSVKDLIMFLKDDEVDMKAFMNKCLEYKLFTYKAPGKYIYDGEVIIPNGGKTGLLTYLKDPENKIFVEGLKQRLNTFESE